RTFQKHVIIMEYALDKTNVYVKKDGTEMNVNSLHVTEKRSKMLVQHLMVHVQISINVLVFQDTEELNVKEHCATGNMELKHVITQMVFALLLILADVTDGWEKNAILITKFIIVEIIHMVPTVLVQKLIQNYLFVRI